MLKGHVDTGENECPDISGIYAVKGDPSINNPQSGPFWLDRLFGLIGVGEIEKVGLFQERSLEMKVVGMYHGKEVIEKTYKREHGDFSCTDNAVVFMEDLGVYSVEGGRASSKIKTELMVSDDGALIVHKLIEKKLAAPFVLTWNTELDGYWYRHPVSGKD